MPPNARSRWCQGGRARRRADPEDWAERAPKFHVQVTPPIAGNFGIFADGGFGVVIPVYEWFTEGFDTADLKDAKALVDELG
jgi:hypothetical protein